jgi:hypothetical protein
MELTERVHSTSHVDSIMRRLHSLILALSASLLLAGCGGGGGGGSSSGGGNSGGGGDIGDSKFTAEQRDAAMDKVADKYDLLLQTNPSTAMEELATYTKTLPEFENAVAKDGTVVAHFKDHRPFIFADNFKGDARGVPAEPANMEMTAPTPVPSKFKAMLLQSNVDDTQGHTGYMAQMAEMLSKRGYSVTTIATIDVDTLKAAAQDLGVFYVHTHGARYWWHDMTDSREYGIFSDTRISDENEAKYTDDLKTGRLIYSRVKNKPMDPDGNRGRYCITSRFVSAYITLKDRGLAYVNACNSASSDASLLRQAFINKGAGVYIGYDGQTTDFGYEPAAYLFDRMLGANLAEAPKPAGRPFQLGEVWTKMALKKHAQNQGYNYLTDPVNGSTLLKFEAGLTMLTPNIRALKFIGRDQMLIVTDVPAGNTDVIVRIEGKEFPYVWQNGAIKVQLEKETKGYVQLEVEDRFSNKRPITSYKGVITYEQPIAPDGIGGDAKLTVKYNVHLRVDAYAIRNEVDGPLLNEGTPYYAAMDTTATYAYSGSIGPANFTGSGTFPFDHHAGPGNTFSTTGLVLANEKRMKIMVNFYEPVATIVSPVHSYDQIFAPNIGGWEFWDKLPVPGREIVYRGWYMNFDDNLNIQAKHYNGFENGLRMHTISWPQMHADPPYDPKVER